MAKKGFVVDLWLNIVAKTTAALASALTANGQVAYDSDKDKAIIRSNGVNDPVVLEARSATLSNKTLTNPVLNGAVINSADGAVLTNVDIDGGTIDNATLNGVTIAGSSVSLNDTASAFNLNLISTSNPPLLTDRELVFDVNNGDRSLDLAGNLAIANDFSTSGDFPMSLITTASTAITLPVTGTLATLAGTETLTNKAITGGSITSADIDGSTASNTSRITIPQAAKAVLDGLTRKEGTILYATDQDTLYIDTGATLAPIGGNFVAYPTESIGNGNSITISASVGLQYRRIVGNGGPVTAASGLFASVIPADGTVVVLVGTSDTDTVSLLSSDTGLAALLNGNITLGLGQSIHLQYDATLNRWIEISRNAF